MLKDHDNEHHKKPYPKSLDGSETADDSSSDLTELADARSDIDAYINPRTDAQIDEEDKEEHEDDDDGSGSDINAHLRAHVVEDDEEDEDYSPTRPRRAQSFDSTLHLSGYGAMPPFRAPTANMMGNTQTKVAQAKQEAEAARRCQYQKHYNTSGDDRRERQTSRHATPSSASRQPPINLGSPTSDPSRLTAGSHPLDEPSRRRNKRRGDDDTRSANAKKSKKIPRPIPSLVVKLKLTRDKPFSVPSRSTSPEQRSNPEPDPSTLDSNVSGDGALSPALQDQPWAGENVHSTQDQNGGPPTREPDHTANVAASGLRQTSHEHEHTNAFATPARSDTPQEGDYQSGTKQQPQAAQIDQAPASLLEAAQRALSFLNDSDENNAIGQALQELRQRCLTAYERDLSRMTSSPDSRKGASVPPTVVQDQTEVASTSPHTITGHDQQPMPNASHRDEATENDRRRSLERSNIAANAIEVQTITTRANPLNPGSVSMNNKPSEEPIPPVTPQKPMPTMSASVPVQAASSDTSAPAKHIPATTQPPVSPETSADTSGAITRASEEPAQMGTTQPPRLPSPATGLPDAMSTDSKASNDPLNRDVRVAPSPEAKPPNTVAVINGMATHNSHKAWTLAT